jgi:hypothetical protein
VQKAVPVLWRRLGDGERKAHAKKWKLLAEGKFRWKRKLREAHSTPARQGARIASLRDPPILGALLKSLPDVDFFRGP